MGIRGKLSLIFFVIYAAALGNIVFTYAMDKFGEEKLSWVVHTHEVLTETSNLIGYMTDAQTGQRGYLLTGNVSYLSPYHSGIRNARASAAKLKTLTIDNHEQQARLEKIVAGMDQKFAELEKTIDLSQTGKRDEALAIVRQGMGERIMGNLRQELNDFTTAEQVLLEARKGDFREGKAYITTAMIGEIIVFIVMAFFTWAFISDKLFKPMQLLLENTAKVENGEKQDIQGLLPNDEMGYLLGRFFKMSEEVQTKTEDLTYDATHDSLTGLKNRAGMHTAIRDSILSLVGTDRSAAVMFVDLNKFKQLNDTLGHDTGDEILKETAHRLTQSIRGDDEVFRLGGDEFVVLLNSIGGREQVQQMADDIIGHFKTPFNFEGESIDICLSMGIAIAPEDSKEVEEILRLADIAMYAQKKEKAGGFKLYERSMQLEELAAA